MSKQKIKENKLVVTKEEATMYQVVMYGFSENEDTFDNLGFYPNIEDAKQAIVDYVNEIRVPKEDYDNEEDYKEDLEEYGLTIDEIDKEDSYEDSFFEDIIYFYHILKTQVKIEL